MPANLSPRAIEVGADALRKSMCGNAGYLSTYYAEHVQAVLTALAAEGLVLVPSSFRSIAEDMDVVAGQHDPEQQTPEQEAACLRALDGMDAQADQWAEKVNLVQMVKNVACVSRLNPKVPKHIREKMANRQEAQIDALIRMAFVEGFYWGGDSRKQYDEHRAMLQAAQGGDPLPAPPVTKE